MLLQIRGQHCDWMGCAHCSGIFLSGERPVWLFASRGTLVAHAMDVEGRVSGMTPFHNINCPLVLDFAFLPCTAAPLGTFSSLNHGRSFAINS